MIPKDQMVVKKIVVVGKDSEGDMIVALDGVPYRMVRV